MEVVAIAGLTPGELSKSKPGGDSLPSVGKGSKISSAGLAWLALLFVLTPVSFPRRLLSWALLLKLLCWLPG